MWKVAFVDSSLQISLPRLLLFPCSLKHSALIWGECRRRKLACYSKQAGKVGKSRVGEETIKDTTIGVLWKPPIMRMASLEERGKGDKQAETAYWGQEFSSHLNIVFKTTTTTQSPKGPISMQERTENDTQRQNWWPVWWEAPGWRPKTTKKTWTHLHSFCIAENPQRPTPPALSLTSLLVPLAPDDGDSWQSSQHWPERPELDEVLKSHIYLDRPTSKGVKGFDEKMLNTISQQGNLQI